jgi:ABC-type Mn2+/Zn2+ transport system permease subunit/Mn-dependent DtxR family transcriptional regulator
LAELFEILSEEWAIRALIASSLVGILCGVLGCFLVLRNMSLIGDALSHAILPGVFVPFMIIGYSKAGFFVGTLTAAIISAIAITWIQNNVKTKNDAAIGIVFTLMFSIGVTGISYLNNAQGVHLDLKDFLFGSTLGISNEDIVITSIVTIYAIASVIVFYRYLFITTFQATIAATMGISIKFVHYFLMLLVSLAIVASLQTVGIILVVAMLITPASTALLLSNNLKSVLFISGLIGLLSAVMGLIGAIILNTPPGPAMCITATLFYALAVVFSPTKGILVKVKNKRHQKALIQREDIIKLMYKAKAAMSQDEIGSRLGYNTSTLTSRLSELSKSGAVISLGKEYNITAKGRDQGQKLVRAHRLWEKYLVDEMGLRDDQIHDDAENLEHILDHEMMDTLDEKLGFPTTDPHGAPIPQRLERSRSPMLNLKPKGRALISKDQISEKVESELFERGLSALMPIQIADIQEDMITVNTSNGSIDIEVDLARKISIDEIS